MVYVGKSKYVLLGLVVGIMVFLIFGTVTALIPNSYFTRMILSKPLDYAFLTLTSILLGAYAGLHFYGKKISSKKEDVVLAGGTISGIFSFSCPICNTILVSLFGVTFVSAYFEPLRPALGVLGIGVLLAVVYMKLQSLK